MDELEFYKLITGEWETHSGGSERSFKYDGFRMYRKKEDEWIEELDWSLVRTSENSNRVTGIVFGFFGLPELLLSEPDKNKMHLDFTDMTKEARAYRFSKTGN